MAGASNGGWNGRTDCGGVRRCAPTPDAAIRSDPRRDPLAGSFWCVVYQWTRASAASDAGFVGISGAATQTT